MSPEQSCQAAEAGLATAQRFLLEPTPENLEKCFESLSEVRETLQGLISSDARSWDPAVHSSFHRVCAGARYLQVQIEYGSRLVQGLAQRRMGAGYTDRGLPQLDEPVSERHFEA